MKKIIAFVLCALMLFACTAALAEDTVFAEQTTEFVGKMVLWTRTMPMTDENGQETEQTVSVTYETSEPVELSGFPLVQNEGNDIYMIVIRRGDIAPVAVSISPANMGPHFNLNDYTEEMLQDYIKSIAEFVYEEGAYTGEIAKSEGGNTYVAVGDDTTRSISTIYDDFVMEVFQAKYDDNAGDFAPLTDEDKAFALEVFQGIWTE